MQFLPLLVLFVAAQAAVFVVTPPTVEVGKGVVINGPFQPTPINSCQCEDHKCNNVCFQRPNCGTGGSCIGNNCYCYKHGPQCPPMPAF